MPKYYVTYAVTRTETYLIEAKDGKEAEQLAFEEGLLQGELSEHCGETTNVEELDTVLIAA